MAIGPYAIVQNGIVVNVLVADSNYVPPAGMTAVASATAQIGWTYAAGELAPPVPTPMTLAQIQAYAVSNFSAVLAAGRTFNVAASGATAVNVLCDGTSTTLGVLALFVAFAQANPTASKTWRDNNGVSTVLNAAECISLATQVGNWADNLYVALGSIEADIAAVPPTITTTAQVDAFAWPVA